QAHPSQRVGLEWGHATEYPPAAVGGRGRADEHGRRRGAAGVRGRARRRVVAVLCLERTDPVAGLLPARDRTKRGSEPQPARGGPPPDRWGGDRPPRRAALCDRAPAGGDLAAEGRVLDLPVPPRAAGGAGRPRHSLTGGGVWRGEATRRGALLFAPDRRRRAD